MKFSIILTKTGIKANIYSIKFAECEMSEYQKFISEHMNSVPDAVRILDTQLKSIAQRFGIRDHNFKRESPESHNVFRLEETEENLRLYCIKFSKVAIVLGNGGIKIKSTKKNSENPHLQKEILFLMKVEDLINQRIKDKEIIVTNSCLIGNLNFEII